MAGVHFSSGRGPTVPTYYIYNLIGQNNGHYYENYEDESRHYVDPESKKGTGDALFNHLIPEVSKLPKYMGELFSSVLTEGQFSALKGAALKNNAITEGMLSWGSVNSEINSGTPPAVAIGTEAARLASNAALGNLGMLGQETGQSANSNVMFLQSSLASASSDLEAADELVVSGYQFYRALKEILDHPEKYPSAEEHIGDIVSAIGTHFLAEEVDQTEQSENAVNDRPLPETVLFSALETLGGLKSIVAEGDTSRQAVSGLSRCGAFHVKRPAGGVRFMCVIVGAAYRGGALCGQRRQMGVFYPATPGIDIAPRTVSSLLQTMIAPSLGR